MSDPREQLMLKYGYPILPFIGEGDSSHTKRNKWFDEDTQIPNCKKTDIIIFFQKKYDKFLDFEQLESECRKGKVKIVPSEFLEEKKEKFVRDKSHKFTAESMIGSRPIQKNEKLKSKFSKKNTALL